MHVAGVLVGGVQCKLVPVACVSVLCGGGVAPQLICGRKNKSRHK